MHTLYLCGVLRARRHGTPRESVLMYDHVKVTLMAALCVFDAGTPDALCLGTKTRQQVDCGRKNCPSRFGCMYVRVCLICLFLCSVIFLCKCSPRVHMCTSYTGCE